MSADAIPALDDVLESFMLDMHMDGALARYIEAYPQFALQLVDVAALKYAEPDDATDLGTAALEQVSRRLTGVAALWPPVPAGGRDLFATLKPASLSAGSSSSSTSIPSALS